MHTSIIYIISKHYIQKMSIVAFIRFQGLWLEHRGFSEDLLSKFLTDMEALISSTKPPHAKIPRLISFLGCFTSVAQSIGSSLASFANKFLQRFFTCLKTVYEKNRDESWLVESNKAVITFTEFMKDNFTMVHLAALDFLMAQFSLPLPETPNLISSVLSTHLQLLQFQADKPLPVFVATKYVTIK